METQAGNGWWQASDGYWYPPEARPDMPWQGEVRGPNGEQPPGPGWWLAADYQWYPPDARPGEVWADPVAVVPGEGRPGRSSNPFATTRAVPMPTEPSVNDPANGVSNGPRNAAPKGAAPAPGSRPAPARLSATGRRFEEAAQSAGLGVVKGLVGVFAGMLLLAATKNASGTWQQLGLVGWLAIAVGFAYVGYGAVRFARIVTNR